MEFQEETCEEDVPSTEMVTEIPRSPSICAQRKNKITEKRKIVKSNLQAQAFKMTRLAGENREKLETLEKSQCRLLIVEDVIQEIS